jgi:hypothetical protein
MTCHRTLIIAVAVCAWMGLSLWTAPTECQAAHTYRTAGDLFYDYYVPPAGYGCRAASMYPCPMPVPPLVGHTYITYQPLMPHEFLYKHRRTYVRQHPNGRVTRTRVSWR